MRAMVLEQIGKPLVLKDLPVPVPGSHEILIKVATCGVCRTDLHVFEGDLPHPKLPLILGHQVVGTIVKLGSQATKHKIGDRVGMPWLAKTCHHCEYCVEVKENLCDNALFNGYLHDGGYAEYCTAHEDYIFPVPAQYDDIHMAPLLCAGLIGYRAFRLANPKKTLGLYGFGSSAHLLIQLAISKGYEVYVFTRPGDTQTQGFARSLGAVWAGGSDELPPVLLDAAILFAAAGELYPQALKAIKKGGKVVSAGIHMSDIPTFPYSLLWEEREMTSVANLTRQDGTDYMKVVSEIHLNATISTYPLEKANDALMAIKHGKLEGSAVLTV